MYILGISCEHDSGAALLKDTGEVLAAVNEERLTGQRLFTGFPRRSIEAVLDAAGIAPGDVGAVAVSTLMHIDVRDWDWSKPSFKRDTMSLVLRLPGMKTLFSQPFVLDAVVRLLGKDRKFIQSLGEYLRDMGVTPKPRFIDHHLTHACAAIHTSGFQRGMALSYDAQGDGYSSKAYTFSDHGKKRTLVYRSPFFKSLAHYYGYVTILCRYKLHGQEGNITGMSALGDPTQTFPLLNERLFFAPGEGRFVSRGCYVRPELAWLKPKLKNFPIEDVAAGIQKHLDENMLAYARHLLSRHREDRLALGGGVFANVQLNQKLSDLPGMAEVHAHPHMGDGGMALGAAATVASESPAYCNVRQRDMCLGPAAAGDVDRLKKEHGLNEIITTDPCLEVAHWLAKGRLVALVEGRLEYGPRPLGHRTVLASPGEASMAATLDERLGRTEAKPVGCLLPREEAEEWLPGMETKAFAMEHGTILCRAGEWLKDKAPAAVHVDGSVRPLLVFPETGAVHRILQHFKDATACPALLAATLTRNSGPMAHQYQDAVEGFLAANIDLLYLDGRLFTKAL